ncbi:MAG: alpha/beta hydrolase, partial [Gemmatimonadetes bacterium]|nr:alpha/beta hydrolase [Gemmatimonadota bacterium]
DFSLNLVSFFMRVKKPWERNFELFADIMRGNDFDLVLGDEAYEGWLHLAKKPAALAVPFVMLFDFMGFDISKGRSLYDRLGGMYVNRLWTATDRRISSRKRGCLQLFVGEADDVPNDRLGPFLSTAREHARRHYQFVGQIVGFDPEDYAERHVLRAERGWSPDERVIVATAGGSAVGRGLLELCGRSFPLIRERSPRTRMVIVCGPRIDPSSLDPGIEGCETLGYVPHLYQLLGAADLTITHAGGSTTTELIALGRPFIYFPLQGDTEQERSVSYRLESLGAGRRLDYGSTQPEDLAAAALEELERTPEYPRVQLDGARVIAERVVGLLR